MGDYTTSISFVCHMPSVFQTNVCQDTKMEKSAKNDECYLEHSYSL